jgi:broad specificity phosphatase PhoE
MKKTLYLMRHGQTLFNVRRKIQGACDSPLTELGIKQAEHTRKYFKSIDLDFAYCSTAERSSDTLEIILEDKLPYTRSKNLKERNFGTFEGESEDLNPTDRAVHRSFFVPYGGEHASQTEERMVNYLTEVMEKENHNNVIAVSHAGACMQFLSHWVDPWTIIKGKLGNCTIFKYEYENKVFRLVEMIYPDLENDGFEYQEVNY